MRVEPAVFLQILDDRLSKSAFWKRQRRTVSIDRLRRFRAHFGMDPQFVAMLWDALYAHSTNNLYGWKPKHLLDALYFLKVYASQDVNAVFSKCDVQTLRRWNWLVVDAIASLEPINFANRYRQSNGSTCLITLDGTDYRIQEPSPFDPMWFSHKFKGAGLRYEVGICIQTGEIVWTNGPFPCGAWPDLRIARKDIVFLINEDERILADGGYNDGGEFFETPTGINNPDQRMKQLARARHETINRRLKQWNILGHVFRHGVEKHSNAFLAVTNITHMLMSLSGNEDGDHGGFQVHYNDS